MPSCQYSASSFLSWFKATVLFETSHRDILYALPRAKLMGPKLILKSTLLSIEVHSFTLSCICGRETRPICIEEGRMSFEVGQEGCGNAD